jgi:hypothetical protein
VVKVDFQENRMNEQTNPFRLFLMAAMVLMLLALSTNAQNTGVVLQGKEAASVTEGVDVFSGTLEQILPLMKIQGRGEANVGLYLPLRNSQWKVMEGNSIQDGNRVYKNYWPNQTNIGNTFRAGYVTLGKLQVETKFPGGMLWETPSVTEVRFTSNNGAIIHFRDVLTNGQPYESQSRGCVVILGFHPNPEPACSRGRVFRAIDGSNALFVADAEIYDAIGTDTWGNTIPSALQNAPAGTLFLSDGTRMRIEGNNPNITRITDRNGNVVKFEYITEPGYTY